MEVFYELTIFEKYFWFEIIIEYFEYMGFYAYMLSFLGPVQRQKLWLL